MYCAPSIFNVKSSKQVPLRKWVEIAWNFPIAAG
jgi:hypothetical protein